MEILAALKVILEQIREWAHAHLPDRQSGPAHSIVLVASAISGQDHAQQRHSDRSVSGLRRVVYIDDDAGMLDLVTLILRKHGLEVLGAGDGPTGLKLIASVKPTLVLIDLMLPEMNGVGVLERLKANPALAQTPVIMLSAGFDTATLRRSQEMGVSEFITEPFLPSLLVDTVERILGLSHENAALDVLTDIQSMPEQTRKQSNHTFHDSPATPLSPPAQHELAPHKPKGMQRLSLNSRRALIYSREAAIQMGHTQIGTGHLLLGLMRDGIDIAARVLCEPRMAGLNISKVEVLVKRKTRSRKRKSSTAVGLSPDIKKVVELAVEEAQAMNDRHIGTGHLLLALVSHKNVALDVLENFKIKPEQIREWTIIFLKDRQLGLPRPISPDSPTVPSQYHWQQRLTESAQAVGTTWGLTEAARRTGKTTGLTDNAERALRFAQEEAEYLDHSLVQPEHLLVGLVREEEGAAGRILLENGVEIQGLRRLAAARMRSIQHISSSSISLSDDSELVFEQAADEARLLGHTMISTEHLLKALVHYRGHAMMRILNVLKIKPDQILFRLNVPGSLRPGFVLHGRYRILGCLGSGETGAVYQARDLDHPNSTRMYAVKEMINIQRDEQLTRQMIRSFDYETKNLSATLGAAIPRIYDSFATEDRFYLAHEFIRGRDLETILNSTDGFLPTDQILEWGIEICKALSPLHYHPAQPVVFGAVMPSNVMIDDHKHVRLLLGGLVHYGKKGMKIMCREGYAPPEQRKGLVSPASDVYALGATLHHLLTGRDPRLEAEFTFDDVAIQNYNPNVPYDLVAVVMRALSYDPRERFASAEEMRQALLKVDSSGTDAIGIPA